MIVWVCVINTTQSHYNTALLQIKKIKGRNKKMKKLGMATLTGDNGQIITIIMAKKNKKSYIIKKDVTCKKEIKKILEQNEIPSNFTVVEKFSEIAFAELYDDFEAVIAYYKSKGALDCANDLRNCVNWLMIQNAISKINEMAYI